MEYSPEERGKRIKEIEEIVKDLQHQQEAAGLDCVAKTDEWFASGVYARGMQLVKNGLIVGSTHTHETINTVSKGTALVATVDGVAEYTAPATFVSRAGTKRVIFAVSDLVWTTYHAHDKFDTEEIRAKYTTD